MGIENLVRLKSSNNFSNLTELYFSKLQFLFFQHGNVFLTFAHYKAMMPNS